MRRHRGLLKTSVWSGVEDRAWGREGERLRGEAAGQEQLWGRRENGGWEGRGWDRGVQGL